MSLSELNWKNYITKIQRQSYLIIGVLSFILLGIMAGGTWYYFQHQQSVRDAEKLQAEQELAKKVKSVNDYYLSILNGVSLSQFIEVFLEVNKSSIPLSISGFKLDNYLCDLSKCTFSYKSSSDKIFNVQELFVFNNEYKANISDIGLEYMVSPSPFTNGSLVEKFQSRMPISVAKCSELVNYIHSFNSMITDGKKRINLSGYPQSSINTIENILPDVKEKYGFLNVQWSVTLPDNIVEMSSFLGRQAYSESFLVNKVEKKKSSDVEVSGILLCAN